MITLEKIQKKIAEAIKQGGLTQTELARRLGIKQQQISCYIHGKKMPALDTLANICAVLDLDANDILCLNDYASKSVSVVNSFNNSSNINFRA